MAWRIHAARGMAARIASAMSRGIFSSITKPNGLRPGATDSRMMEGWIELCTENPMKNGTAKAREINDVAISVLMY